MTQELTIRGAQSIMLSPVDVVANAATQAKLLMDIVEKTGCFQLIAKKKYLQVEAWETIGAFNRVHAVTESITPIKRDDIIVGYDAKVNLVNQDGLVVGAAIMPCYFTENACKGKEGDAKDKASKSAAQTFATSKAYRMNYSYVAILAGYEPTPAEELTGEDTIGGVKPDAKQEHWCAEHHTLFFKSGNMKGYAHKLDDGSWHNEPTSAEKKRVASPPDAPQAPQSKSTAGEPLVEEEAEQQADTNVLSNGLNLEDIKQQVADLQWSDVGLYLKSKYGVTGKRVTEMLEKLTYEQAEDFVKTLEERRRLK